MEHKHGGFEKSALAGRRLVAERRMMRSYITEAMIEARRVLSVMLADEHIHIQVEASVIVLEALEPQVQPHPEFGEPVHMWRELFLEYREVVRSSLKRVADVADGLVSG